MDNDKVAGVLEEAARLYRDEKVQWCTGSWVEGHNDNGLYDETGQPMFDDPETVISACAEGALLKAAGYQWEMVNDYNKFAKGNEDKILRTNVEAMELFNASRDALGQYLLEHQEEAYVSSSTIERADDHGWLVSIPGWNDTMTTQIVERAFVGDEVDIDALSEPGEAAKAVVIDAMEATAKDLRNG